MIKLWKTIILKMKQWREVRIVFNLIGTLPKDYQIVLKEMAYFMYKISADVNMVKVIMDTFETFTVAQNDKNSVLSITGEDIGGFCYNILKNNQIKTIYDLEREKFNSKIFKKINNIIK